MNNLPVLVGYCVAYDWEFLAFSLPLIYNRADSICLSIDQDFISWAGKKFDFDEDRFMNMIEAIDKNKKIHIYKDNFHLPELTPMQNEVRQRHMIASYFKMRDAWYIQLDADEYFLDFDGFVNLIQRFNKSERKINICCPWITMYKQIGNDYFLVQPTSGKGNEFIQIATRWPHYEYGRRNGYFNILTNYYLLHQSWARSEREIEEKLNNWGHSHEIDAKHYFHLWKSCNTSNYQSYKNFHHLGGNGWPGLLKIEAHSIEDLSKKLRLEKIFSIESNYLRMANSVWLSRYRAMLKKVSGKQ